MSEPKPAEAWTIRKVLDWTRGHFEKQDIDAPRLTAELLLAHVLATTRVRLFMDLDRPLTKDELATYRALIQRRLSHEPTQYLVGHKEFYGRRFAVDARVLIPRSETELLVEAGLAVLPKDGPARVLDVCTGSGCIAVSIAAERPHASVWACDVSGDALEVANKNAEALAVSSRVTFFQGSLLEPVPADARFDLIVSNPPYIPTKELAGLDAEVRREPHLALDGGDDGLAVIRPLVAAAAPRLNPGGWLALEIAEDQGARVKAVLEGAGLREVRVEKDLARHERLVLGRRAPA
ncbi:MAG: peptide chain release factor N(5)-glutamine methyltransferase [Myxococcaceae bacterium]|nr:peptide chain release factor N(5)-glutamine methyltransferase [Myxococcaceae bacterium]